MICNWARRSRRAHVAVFAAAILHSSVSAFAGDADTGEAADSPLQLAEMQLAAAGTAAAAAKPAAVPLAVAEPKATDQWLGGSQTRTRFVIGLDTQAQFQVFSLGNPNRVIVELPDIHLQLPNMTGDKPIGLVKSFRSGLSAPGKTRIVIDVTEAVVVENARIEKGKDGKPARLALEIVPVEALKTKSAKMMKPAFALGAAGVQPPLPMPAISPKVKAARAFKPVIVLDPGHGGHDSGAMKNGTVEKDVVLAFSLALRDKLNASGRYKVLMTRDTDTFVPLDDRRDFAEKNKAGLFIAIHADYAGTKAHGATIYSLRDGVANDLKRSAKGQVTDKLLSSAEESAVKEATGDVSTVKGILSDLAEREVDATKDRTSVFAKSVIDTMGESTDLRDNPDQQAAYRVLKSAQVPSVLIELAYVTNKQDADNLKSVEWRDKVADSILSAVENYFSHQVAHLPM